MMTVPIVLFFSKLRVWSYQWIFYWCFNKLVSCKNYKLSSSYKTVAQRSIKKIGPINEGWFTGDVPVIWNIPAGQQNCVYLKKLTTICLNEAKYPWNYNWSFKPFQCHMTLRYYFVTNPDMHLKLDRTVSQNGKLDKLKFTVSSQYTTPLYNSLSNLYRLIQIKACLEGPGSLKKFCNCWVHFW